MSRRERTQVVLQAIRELSSDPSLYARGRWQRARMEIAELIEQHTRVQISPHAVSKYQKLAGYPSLKGHHCVLCARRVFRVGREEASFYGLTPDDLDSPFQAPEGTGLKDAPCCSGCRNGTPDRAQAKAEKFWNKARIEVEIHRKLLMHAGQNRRATELAERERQLLGPNRRRSMTLCGICGQPAAKCHCSE
jgi:hypothetical protein